jgi:hypothetical protein
MASLLDLKTRIRLETNKDDIASGGEAEAALDRAISRAIEYYQDERFWFNVGSETAVTVASTATVARPAVRVADKVTISNSGSVSSLTKGALGDFIENSSTGVPSSYAEYGDSLYLYPIPNGAYTLTLYGVRDIAAPTLDAESTVWTNEAYDLIAAHARFILYRDIWRDQEGAVLAKGAIEEALGKLRRETRRRNAGGLRSDLPLSGGFSMIRG